MSYLECENNAATLLGLKADLFEDLSIRHSLSTSDRPDVENNGTTSDSMCEVVPLFFELFCPVGSFYFDNTLYNVVLFAHARVISLICTSM